MKSILFAALFFMAGCASKNDNAEIFQTDGKAIKGFDPVAFQIDGKAVAGSENYTFKWKNAEWFFASQAHLDSFKMAPEHYAPQYGGYCAYGTAAGHKAPTETDTWTVKDGKLYFNYNKEVQQKWNKDQKGYIEKADKTWPEIKDDKL